MEHWIDKFEAAKLGGFHSLSGVNHHVQKAMIDPELFQLRKVKGKWFIDQVSWLRYLETVEEARK